MIHNTYCESFPRQAGNFAICHCVLTTDLDLLDRQSQREAIALLKLPFYMNFTLEGIELRCCVTHLT